MEKLLIINGSPRAKKSNSGRYAEIFKTHYKGKTSEYIVASRKHEVLFEKINYYSDILFVFPLYCDSVPTILLDFLKSLSQYKSEHKPTVHVMINCGFIEPKQNFTAVEIMRLFAKQSGYPFGSILCIGSGEAILDTPFRFCVERKIRSFARSVKKGQKKFASVTMPLTKKIFVRASTNYWIKYGERNGITKMEMETMEIE